MIGFCKYLASVRVTCFQAIYLWVSQTTKKLEEHKQQQRQSARFTNKNQIEREQTGKGQVCQGNGGGNQALPQILSFVCCFFSRFIGLLGQHLPAGRCLLFVHFCSSARLALHIGFGSLAVPGGCGSPAVSEDFAVSSLDALLKIEYSSKSKKQRDPPNPGKPLKTPTTLKGFKTLLRRHFSALKIGDWRCTRFNHSSFLRGVPNSIVFQGSKMTGTTRLGTVFCSVLPRHIFMTFATFQWLGSVRIE